MLDDPDDYEEEDIPDEEDPQALTMREQREFAQARQDFENSGRAEYDSLLDKVRQSSAAIGVALPSPEAGLTVNAALSLVTVQAALAWIVSVAEVAVEATFSTSGETRQYCSSADFSMVTT